MFYEGDAAESPVGNFALEVVLNPLVCYTYSIRPNRTRSVESSKIMATTQMNIRISPSVKQAGDAALDKAGYSPTRAIRALWEFAGRNRGNEKELRKMLEVLEGEVDNDSHNAEISRRLQVAGEGPLIIERALSEMGIPVSSYSDETSYDELLEQALYEKMKERGLDR